MMYTPGTVDSKREESSGNASASEDTNCTPSDSTNLREGTAPSRVMMRWHEITTGPLAVVTVTRAGAPPGAQPSMRVIVLSFRHSTVPLRTARLIWLTFASL